MDDIKFNCRVCDQHLSIEADAAGMDIQCPACGTTQQVPLPAPVPPPVSPVAVMPLPETIPNPPLTDATSAADSHYWAFISYSSKDQVWARWLHRAIETYGFPIDLIEHLRTPSGHPAPKRFHPVFRDRDELPASADLGAVIKKALSDSRYLIVICSPNAAQSQWVNKEIETFLALGRRQHILAIIVDGEPNAGDRRECFPPALRQFEPIAADARPHADGKSNAKLKLLAGMLGVHFDSLKQRDARRRKKQRTLAGVAAGLLFSLVATLIGVAVNQRRTATEERGKGERRRYVADMLKVQNTWERGATADFLTLLDAQRPQHQGDVDHRGWEWYYWLKRTSGEARKLKASEVTINSLWFSPDGRQLVTGCREGMLKTWDLSNGEEIHSLPLKGSTRKGNIPPELRTLAKYWQDKVMIWISPDGKWLATSSPIEKTVRIWNAQSGEELLTVPGNSQKIACVCFSPDGTRLATGSFGEVKVWDARSGKELFTAGGNENLESDFGSLCFSPDGKQLAAGYVNATTLIWDVATGKVAHRIRYKGTREFKANDIDVNSVCFSPDGRFLATGNTDGTEKVWDTNNGKVLLSLEGHEDEVTSVCFSPDGKQVATGSIDQTVRVWDATTGKELYSYPGHFNEIIRLSFNPDGTMLASCDDDGIVKLWRGASAETLPLALGSGPVFLSDGGLRAASVDSDALKVWDLESGKECLSIPVTGVVESVQFSSDGKRLAIGGGGTRVESGRGSGKRKTLFRPTQVWDTVLGKKLYEIKQYASDEDNDTIGSLCFSPDGRMLALCAYIGAGAFVWDLEKDKEVQVRSWGMGSNSGTVCFSPDGQKLVVSRYICNAQNGTRLVTLENWNNDFGSMCFSPDGMRHATGGYIRDATSGKLVCRYKGELPCFTPDGKRIAAATSTGVKIYAVEDGQELLTLKGLAAEVSSICFSPDGERLLVGHVNGKLETWSAAPAE